jgi:small GTP-binding protein
MINEDEFQDNNNIKIILLGSFGVGKTSIIKSFNKKKFNEYEHSTLSCNFISKTVIIDNKNYICDIWDTAGQERFRSLNKLFIKDSKIIILVYDISQRKTFIELKYWIDFIHENLDLGDVTLGIVGNKSDLYKKEDVTVKEGQDLASKQDAYFSLLSAKVDSPGIESYFERIIKIYLEKNITIKKVLSSKIIKIANEDGRNRSEKKGFCGGWGKSKKEKIYEIKNDDSIKIIFLGNNGVGKTSMIKAIKGLEINKEYESTSNICTYPMTLTRKEKEYNINIIDTNGDITFHSKLEQVIKKCSIFIIVFDLTERKTFNYVSKWLEIISDYIKSENDKKMLVILGNKTNLAKKKNICIKKEDGIKFAEKYNSHYLEISIEEKHLLKNLIKNSVSKYLYNVNKI